MDEQRGYAKSDGTHIAYWVTGVSPLALLYVGASTLSIDSFDEEPHAAHFFRRLASFSRLIRYDPRGIGLSDPIDLGRPPELADMARHAEAVLDAVGVDRVVIVAEAGGGLVAMQLAVTAPERVSALVLANCYARIVTDDDYPHGHPRELIDSFLQRNLDPDDSWSQGGADDLALIAPSMRHDAGFAEWWHRAAQRGASPASARAIVGTTALADIRDILPRISARTLVVHRAGNQFIPAPLGRYLGDHIPDAHYLELPGADHATFTGDADELLDHIEDFLTGQRTGGAERVLATVLFTDIVDSTGRAAALGDRAWRTFLDMHDAIVRTEIRRYGGREINTTGDGFVGTFDSPTQAVQSARAIVATAAAQGIAVRAGAHTGECERRGRDLAGLTVHIAARVAALAASGEVLVSRTVRDLVAGSELRFTNRGEHKLKGVPDTWQLFALET